MLRKQAHSDETQTGQYLEPDGVKMAVAEYLRLVGKHSKYPLQQWAVECGIPQTTLQSQINNMSELEKEVIKMIGQEAQAEEEECAEKRKQILAGESS